MTTQLRFTLEAVPIAAYGDDYPPYPHGGAHARSPARRGGAAGHYGFDDGDYGVRAGYGGAPVVQPAFGGFGTGVSDAGPGTSAAEPSSTGGGASWTPVAPEAPLHLHHTEAPSAGGGIMSVHRSNTLGLGALDADAHEGRVRRGHGRDDGHGEGGGLQATGSSRSAARREARRERAKAAAVGGHAVTETGARQAYRSGANASKPPLARHSGRGGDGDGDGAAREQRLETRRLKSRPAWNADTIHVPKTFDDALSGPSARLFVARAGSRLDAAKKQLHEQREQLRAEHGLDFGSHVTPRVSSTVQSGADAGGRDRAPNGKENRAQRGDGGSVGRRSNGGGAGRGALIGLGVRPGGEPGGGGGGGRGGGGTRSGARGRGTGAARHPLAANPREGRGRPGGGVRQGGVNLMSHEDLVKLMRAARRDSESPPRSRSPATHGPAAGDYAGGADGDGDGAADTRSRTDDAGESNINGEDRTRGASSTHTGQTGRTGVTFRTGTNTSSGAKPRPRPSLADSRKRPRRRNSDLSSDGGGGGRGSSRNGALRLSQHSQYSNGGYTDGYGGPTTPANSATGTSAVSAATPGRESAASVNRSAMSGVSGVTSALGPAPLVFDGGLSSPHYGGDYGQLQSPGPSVSVVGGIARAASRAKRKSVARKAVGRMRLSASTGNAGARGRSASRSGARSSGHGQSNGRSRGGSLASPVPSALGSPTSAAASGFGTGADSHRRSRSVPHKGANNIRAAEREAAAASLAAEQQRLLAAANLQSEQAAAARARAQAEAAATLERRVKELVDAQVSALSGAPNAALRAAQAQAAEVSTTLRPLLQQAERSVAGLRGAQFIANKNLMTAVGQRAGQSIADNADVLVDRLVDDVVEDVAQTLLAAEVAAEADTGADEGDQLLQDVLSRIDALEATEERAYASLMNRAHAEDAAALGVDSAASAAVTAAEFGVGIGAGVGVGNASGAPRSAWSVHDSAFPESDKSLLQKPPPQTSSAGVQAGGGDLPHASRVSLGVVLGAVDADGGEDGYFGGVFGGGSRGGGGGAATASAGASRKTRSRGASPPSEGWLASTTARAPGRTPGLQSALLARVGTSKVRLPVDSALVQRVLSARDRFRRHRNVVEASLADTGMEQWEIIEWLADIITQEVTQEVDREVQGLFDEYADVITKTL